MDHGGVAVASWAAEHAYNHGGHHDTAVTTVDCRIIAKEVRCCSEGQAWGTVGLWILHPL